MNEMNITAAKYNAVTTYSDDRTTVTGTENVGIIATIDGETIGVPLTPGNRHYDEIMKQVEAGDLTIADAD